MGDCDRCGDSDGEFVPAFDAVLCERCHDLLSTPGPHGGYRRGGSLEHLRGRTR